MFYWHKKEKEFRQDASSLQIPAGVVYKRITLKNPRTGGTCKFKLINHTAENGEVVAWRYKSYWPIDNLRIIIWND